MSTFRFSIYIINCERGEGKGRQVTDEEHLPLPWEQKKLPCCCPLTPNSLLPLPHATHSGCSGIFYLRRRPACNAPTYIKIYNKQCSNNRLYKQQGSRAGGGRGRGQRQRQAVCLRQGLGALKWTTFLLYTGEEHDAFLNFPEYSINYSVEKWIKYHKGIVIYLYAYIKSQLISQHEKHSQSTFWSLTVLFK